MPLGQPTIGGPALPDPAAIRDTLDAVFRSPAFDRSLGQRLWDGFVHLVQSAYGLLRDGALASPAAYWLVLALLALVAAYALARGAVAWDARVRRRGGAARSGGGGDPWRAAELAAAEGRLVAAAHLLHAAVVDALARHGLVRVHHAKTVGDYARELARGRGAGAADARTALAAYRSFARRYEPFVYATGAADATRWAALRAAAEAARAASATADARREPTARPAQRPAAGAA